MWKKQSTPAGVSYLYQKCKTGAGLWAHCLSLLPSSGIITTLASHFDCSVCQLSGTAVLSWYPPYASCLYWCCHEWLISNTDSVRYLEWEVWKWERKCLFWMIWSPLPRVEKAASSIGYQTQHFSSSLSFCVAALASTRQGSILWWRGINHCLLFFLNRDDYEKQKIQFWWGHIEWILQMLCCTAFTKYLGNVLEGERIGHDSMCDTQQRKILSVTHAGWSRKDLPVMFSLHMLFT